MNISLPPELEAFVNDKVRTGCYQTASEVIGEGLRLLQEQGEHHEAGRDSLRKEIEVGIEQLERGEHVAFDEALVKRIKTEGRKRLAKPGKKNPA